MRVRASDPYVRQLIAEGTERSVSFRALLAEIQASDGLVWIERGACPRILRACLSHHVTLTAGNRLLRVTVRQGRKDDDTIAAIAHELRHVTEVLADPRATSYAGMYYLYQRIGSWRDGVVETEAAIETGTTVRSELSAFARVHRRQHFEDGAAISGR